MWISSSCPSRNRLKSGSGAADLSLWLNRTAWRMQRAGWPAMEEWDRTYASRNTPTRILWLLRTTGADYFVFNKDGAEHAAICRQDRRMVPGLAIAYQNAQYVVYRRRCSGAPKSANPRRRGGRFRGFHRCLDARRIDGSERQNEQTVARTGGRCCWPCGLRSTFFWSRLDDASPKPFGTPIRFVAAPCSSPPHLPHRAECTQRPARQEFRLAFVGDIMQHREQMH